MGKSGSTTQDNVKKRPTVYTESKDELIANANGAADGGEKVEQINACMIRFDFSVVDSTGTLQLGDAVILVPEGVGGVQLLSRGYKVASFVGDLTGTLYECMKLGYTYRGEVISTNTDTGQATVRVIARGRV